MRKKRMSSPLLLIFPPPPSLSTHKSEHDQLATAMTLGVLLDQTRVCTAALAGLMVAESCRVWLGLRMVVVGALIATDATLMTPVAVVEAVRVSAKVAVMVDTPLPTAF